MHTSAKRHGARFLVAVVLAIFTSTEPARASAVRPCAPHGRLPGALVDCGTWIAFSPPRPFDPTRGVFPRKRELRVALAKLHQEGWRGVVTWSMDGTLEYVPRLARALGFTAVIAGLYWYDDAQLGRERAAALAERAWVDGFVLGNEGLLSGRYSPDRLATEIERLEADSGRPVTTCEPGGSYLDNRRLLGLGAWIFPNIHPWYANRRTASEAIAFVEAQYRAIADAAPGRTVVLKEVWWPSAGDPSATPDGQAEFFRRLRQTNLPFVFGAAYDASWNVAEGPVGQHWGLHSDNGAPKAAVLALQHEWLWSLPSPGYR